MELQSWRYELWGWDGRLDRRMRGFEEKQHLIITVSIFSP